MQELMITGISIQPDPNAKLTSPRPVSSPGRWQAAFSENGHLDIAKVLRRIQRGGVHPAIKGFVWEFLLGCYDPNTTFEERNQLRQCRREQYSRWKAECQTMVPVVGSGKFITTPIITDDGQPVIGSCTGSSHEGRGSSSVLDKKVIQWMLNLHQIGLDVVRTDQALVFYQREINLARLWDVLAVYAWVDNDIGYVQGMSDICWPMIVLIENEADAFWCFDHAMRRLRDNFKCSTSSIGVQTQLRILSQVIKTIDPKLHQHLECFQLIWAMEYSPNTFCLYEKPTAAMEGNAELVSSNKLLKQCGKFERKIVKTGTTDQQSALAIFLVAGVLEAKNKRILKEAKGLDDVVQILGDIRGNLDARKVCNEALKIHKRPKNHSRQETVLLRRIEQPATRIPNLGIPLKFSATSC